MWFLSEHLWLEAEVVPEVESHGDEDDEQADDDPEEVFLPALFGRDGAVAFRAPAQGPIVGLLLFVREGHRGRGCLGLVVAVLVHEFLLHLIFRESGRVGWLWLVPWAFFLYA